MRSSDPFVPATTLMFAFVRPPAAAVYWILQTCLQEIMRAGLIPPVVRPFAPARLLLTDTQLGQRLLDFKAVEVYRSAGAAMSEDDREWQCSSLLFDLAHCCKVSSSSLGLVDCIS